MDEVRIVRHRTHIWPVIIAVIILAIVIGYVFFAKSGPAKQVGWNAPTVTAPTEAGRALLEAGAFSV